MKALSIIQPWATLLAMGAKKIETRSYRTPYRGPLLIHASKTLSPSGMQLAKTEPFLSAPALRPQAPKIP
jgi:hypothetical protein